jgi:peroxiredoxin
MIVAPNFTADQLTIIGINKSSSVSWLQMYRAQKGISYPCIYDAHGDIFKQYQVGPSYGNIPPSYFIIDTTGIVRYRIDNTLNRFNEMIGTIRGLLPK